MAQQKVAVVVGALGVIGRYIVERLVAEDGWSVIGLSRRDAASGPRYRHLPVDLLNSIRTAAGIPLRALRRRPSHGLPIPFDL